MISKQNKAKNWLLNISKGCRLNKRIANNLGYKNTQNLMYSFHTVIKKYGITNIIFSKRRRKWYIDVKNGRAIQTIFPIENNSPIVNWEADFFNRHINLFNWLTNLKEDCLLTLKLAKEFNYDQTQNLRLAIVSVSKRFNLDVEFKPSNKNMKCPKWILTVNEKGDKCQD